MKIRNKITLLLLSLTILWSYWFVKTSPVFAACNATMCNCSLPTQVVPDGNCPPDCIASHIAATNNVNCHPPLGTVATPNNWISSLGSNGPINPGTGIDWAAKRLIPFLIALMIFIVIVLSIIFLIFGGITWIISSGSKEGTAKAKGIITYALVGLGLGLLAIVIVNAITGLFGASYL